MMSLQWASWCFNVKDKKRKQTKRIQLPEEEREEPYTVKTLLLQVLCLELTSSSPSLCCRLTQLLYTHWPLDYVHLTVRTNPTQQLCHDSYFFKAYTRRNEVMNTSGKKCLCQVAGLSLRDGVRSSDTQRELGVVLLPLHVKRWKSRWFRYVAKMPLVHLPLEVYHACPDRRTPWCRCWSHWRDYISHLAWEHPGIPQEEPECMARERDVWDVLFTQVEDNGGTWCSIFVDTARDNLLRFYFKW